MALPAALASLVRGWREGVWLGGGRGRRRYRCAALEPWRADPLPYLLRWELAIPRPNGSLRRALAARTGERILEIGPGLGQHAVEVAGYVGPGGRVDVLDVQHEMLDATTARGIPFAYHAQFVAA